MIKKNSIMPSKIPSSNFPGATREPCPTSQDTQELCFKAVPHDCLFLPCNLHGWELPLWKTQCHADCAFFREVDQLALVYYIERLSLENLNLFWWALHVSVLPLVGYITFYYLCMLLLQSCLTLCNPMDHSPPGSFVHGILQTLILEWVAILSFRGSSEPRDETHVSCVSCIGSQVLYHKHHLGSPHLSSTGQ